MPVDIEDELTEASGIHPSRPRQEYLKALTISINTEIPESAWEALSPEAQKWAADAGAILRKDKNATVPDYKTTTQPERRVRARPEPEPEDVEEVEEPAPTAAAAPKRDGRRAPARAPAPPVEDTEAGADAPAVVEGRRPGAENIIKLLVAQNPLIKDDAIIDKMSEYSYAPSKALVSQTRSNFVKSLKLLQAGGYLQGIDIAPGDMEQWCVGVVNGSRAQA